MQALVPMLKEEQASHGCKESHSAAYRKTNPRSKMQRSRVSFVISQPMHGGGWSTCPSKNLTKCGSIPIVNTAHPIMNYIIANNTNNAIDYIIKIHIIANNEIYAIDLLTSSYDFL